jgi:hypothetical protein
MIKVSLLSCSAGAFLALALPVLAANSSTIQSPLTATGVDPDASGRVIASLGTNKSELIVSVSKLSPNSGYDIEVGGIVEATLATSGGGGGSVKFRTPKPGRGPLLDFDPRGKLLRVLSSGQTVLEATISAAGEPAGATVNERVNLAPLNGATGKARADFRLDKKGRRRFSVEVERAGAGPFELFVGGVKHGDFTLLGVEAKIDFRTGSDDPEVLPLDFDPRSQIIDVVRNGTIIFSGELAAKARGVNVSTPRLATVVLPSTGADSDGHAEAKLRIDDRARKHFSVEIEDVPTGTYDLFVDGVDVADIVVTTTTSGTKGEVEFTGGDDDPDELPLTFDPVGRTLTISQGATKFFEGTFKPSTRTAGGVPSPEAPSELEEQLTSTGVDPDASAHARYRVDDRGRHKFDVEVEDVPVGSYSLVVAGTVRGTIRVASTSKGVEGEIEFDSKSELGHLLLNFDPRGQLIEITSGGQVYFSHLLGAGSGGGGGGAIPFGREVPLLSSGVDSNASAKAQVARKADGEMKFEVEVEDVDTGA